MKSLTKKIVAAGLLAAGTLVSANDLTWAGVNRNDSDSLPTGDITNVDDASVWGGTVPVAGDTAIFSWDVGNNNLEGTVYYGHVYIDSSTPTFAPDILRFHANGTSGNGWRSSRTLFIDRDITFEQIEIRGSTSNNSGGRGSNRLWIGNNVSGTTVTVSGSGNPFDFSQHNNAGYWGMLRVDAGSTLRLTGSTINFATVPDGNTNRGGTMSGGTFTENATNTANGWFNFDNPASSVHLAQQGYLDGTINFGFTNLGVHSTQTWTADDNAYINLTPRQGASGESGPYLINPLDSQRLDNLGELNLHLANSSGWPERGNISETRAPRLAGGTYGGIYMRQTYGNNFNRFQLDGDVTLAGRAVERPNRGDALLAAASDYSLILDGHAQVVHANGHDLTLNHGLLLHDTDSTATLREVLLDVRGSTVTIHGDVRALSEVRRPVDTDVNDRIGFQGDAGTVLNLHGDWDTRVAARTGTNLNLATMNLLAGSGSEPQLFEVGDAASASGVGDDSFAIGTLNIGLTGQSAVVQLVNNHLNDNPFNGDANVDKAGEKLIIGTLNINADSTLIANLGVASVEVGPDTLHIDPTGTLDLFTNMSLGMGDLVPNFVGLGDQTSSWTSLAGLVIDSTNPNYEFAPTLNGDLNTVWQVAAIPEPSSLMLILLACLTVIGLRRRR